MLFSLGLIVVLAILYLPYLSGQACFYRMDASCFFEPLCNYLGDRLRHGHLPLWNSQVYCGMSQVAVSSPGIFYPPNLIFMFAPFSSVLALVLIFHQLIAGLGMYLLIMSMGWGLVPAVVAGSSFALCGYMFSQYYNYTLMATAAWLPLCFWALFRISTGISARNVAAVAAAAAAFCLMITAGRPEIWLPGLCLSALVVLLAPFGQGLRLADGKPALLRGTCDEQPNGIQSLPDAVVDPRSDGSDLDNVAGREVERAVRNVDALEGGSASFGCAAIVKQLGWRMLAIGCGIALSMPSTLPSMEWASVSPRERGLAWIEVLGYSANWYDFLGLLLNRPLGDVEAFGARYAPLVVAPLEQFPLASSVFVGPVFLTLAMWALFETGWSLRWFLLAGLVAFSLLAAGKNAFFAPWLMQYCPSFVPLRYPAKLLIFPIGFLSVLAARGAFICLAANSRLFSQIAVAASWLFVLVVSSACAVQAQFILDCPVLPLHGQAGSLAGEAISLIGQAGEIASIVGLATALLRVFLDRKWISKKLAAALIVLIPVAMSLAAGIGTLSHGASPSFYQTVTSVRLAVLQHFASESREQYRYMPFMYFPLTPPSAVPGADWTEKYYQYKRQILMPNQILDTSVACSIGYETAWTIDHKRLMDAVGHEFIRRSPPNWDICKISNPATPLAGSAAVFNHPEYFDKDAHQLPFVRFCKLTATKYVLTPQVRTADGSAFLLKVLDPEHFELLAQYPDANARLYRVKEALPRAYFAANWKPLGSGDRFLELLLSKKYDEFDPAAVTYIEKSASERLSARLPQLEPARAGAVIQSANYSDEDITLTVRTAGSSLLVLADTFYPGWSVTVDGQPSEILRANLMNRAVVVPSGTHVVQFQYAPISLVKGVVISALTAVLLLLLLAAAVWIGRSRNRADKG